MGKPESWVFKICMERMNLGPEEVASLGDRLNTDVAGAQQLGLKTILVMSGVCTHAELEASSIKPTWVFRGIDEMALVLKALPGAD